MPDNVQITSGTGASIATDEISGIHYQRVKPAFGADGTATDVSAANPLPVVASGYDAEGDKLLVGTARERFFTSFYDFDTTSNGDWEVVQTGSGMTISGPLGGAAAGSTPYVNIASGTTTNQQTIILSRSAWRAPIEVRFQITASQRIVNNQLRIGFVEVDPSTGAILTDTTYATVPAVAGARNAVMLELSGTTATSGSLVLRTAGAALDTQAAAFGTGFTTIATGSTPNFLAPTTFGLSMERDRTNVRAWGQNVLTNTGGQFSNDRVLPNPTKLYKLAIIVENGATAPASTTDWRIHLVNVMDATRFDVSPRAAGATDLSRAFPIIGTVTATVSSTVPTVTPILYADTTTALGASATFTGTSRDGGSTATYNAFCATATSNVAGTLWIDTSTDNSTWFAATSAEVAAGKAVVLECPAFTRYMRVRYVNGAGAQASFAVRSMFRRI